MRKTLFTTLMIVLAITGRAQTIEPLKYGDFNKWVVRHIKESRIIGGNTKILYEIGPNQTITENKAYTNAGGSPWATSNVYAKVAGVVKTNVSVYKDKHDDGYCARLETHHEEVVVLGLVNIKVLAAGSIFLGEMIEPLTSTKNPMSKMSWGMPLTKRPKALIFDYKNHITDDPDRIRETGFSKISKVPGKDMSTVILFLQKRWEDAEGNIHALRVGTMVHRFGKSHEQWQSNARFEIHYGDITKESFFKPYMGLNNNDDDARYALNSKGKNVRIHEDGWAAADEMPTHIILQFASSYGGAYIGSIGTTLWVDNVRLEY